MKLIFCPKCGDVRKLLKKRTVCECGDSYGQYTDNLNAEIGGKAIPIGFANQTFARALLTRPKAGLGSDFVAFVIPGKCDTITQVD